ncbi:MAG: hypothetical protein ACLUB2_00710 [Butyricicoccus pullicaecorum]
MSCTERLVNRRLENSYTILPEAATAAFGGEAALEACVIADRRSAHAARRVRGTVLS